MIDWIFFTLPPKTLDNCSFLLFIQPVESTGELGKWKIAHWGVFEIKVNNHSGRIEVRGSLHKYWSKSHNGGSFPRWAVAQAVQKLADELKFNPVQGELHGFEFGVNVPMPTPAKHLLRRAVLSAKRGRIPKPLNSKHSEKGLLREVVAEQYFDKLYDKEQQLTAAGYAIHALHLLRVEVKVRKMQLLQKAGVRTLADLANPDALAIMGEILLEHLNSVLFAVPGKLPSTLRASQQRILRDGATAGYWDGLTQPQLRAQVKRFRMAKELVPDVALEAAIQGLRSGWQMLLHEPVPPLSVATVVEPNTPQVYHSYRVLTSSGSEPPAPPLVDDARAGGLQLCPPALTIDDDDDEREPTTTGSSLQSTSSSSLQPTTTAALQSTGSSLQPPAAARCCLTCGRVLNSSNSRAKFCSERVWGNAAKKCRNDASNPRNNAVRTLRKIDSQWQLFDQRPFVRVPEQIRAFVLAAV